TFFSSLLAWIDDYRVVLQITTLVCILSLRTPNLSTYSMLYEQNAIPFRYMAVLQSFISVIIHLLPMSLSTSLRLPHHLP
ncbi:uncharacterized protein BJ212DRAFT_1387340, partial [Suillus subaureus]